MEINIIFATDENGLFGYNNEIPWKCYRDMQHFKKVTTTGIR
jgi:dihydrofolate reductase